MVNRCLTSWIILLLLTYSAWGIEWDPTTLPSWEEVVLDSDFVGVVKTIYSGAAISEFKVVESWKGEVTATLRLPYPAASVGDQLLVALKECQLNCNSYLDAGLGSVFGQIGGMERLSPLWPEPPITHYYTDSIRFSRFNLRTSRELGNGDYGEHLDTVEVYKQATKAILSTPPETLEAQLLQAKLRYLLKPWQFHQTLALQEGQTPEDIVLILLGWALADEADEALRKAAASALIYSGEKNTLQLLQAHEKPQDFEDRKWLEQVIEQLEDQLERKTSSPTPAPSESAQVSLSVKEVRALLSASSTSYEGRKAWTEAMHFLVREEPVTVARFLSRLAPKSFNDEYAGHNIAMWFVRNCGEQQFKCYNLLSESPDPEIAKVGLVYLSIVKPGRGVKKLKRMAEIPGVDGAWAAAVLVALGEKAQVSRALDLYKVNSHNTALYTTRHLLLAVLSNSAMASGVPQPQVPTPYETSSPPNPYDFYLQWWELYWEDISIQPLRISHQGDDPTGASHPAS